MIKRTLIWNYKGGMGKTTLALQIAMLEDAFIVANEELSIVPDIIGEERGIAIKHDDPLPLVPRDVPLIYDFGGYAEGRVAEAAADSDYVIIPVSIQNLHSVLEIQGTINAITAIRPHNPNIVVVNNKSKKGHMQYVMDAFDQVGIKDIKLLDVKESTSLSRSVAEKMSIEGLIAAYPLTKQHFSVGLLQIKTLIKHISQ